MAIYHLSMRNISRNTGKSFFNFVAYINGEKLKDPESGRICNYESKDEVQATGIVLCDHAPQQWKNKEILWKDVLSYETKSNARLAKEFNGALPIELSDHQNIEIIKQFSERLADHGMCINWSFHNKQENPHAHFLCTTRLVDQSGNWEKQKVKTEYVLDENGNRIPLLDENGVQKRGKKNDLRWKQKKVWLSDFDQKDFLKVARKEWEDVVNQYLSDDLKIDCRSLKEQGIDRVPTIHLGKGAHVVDSDRKATNDQIIALNLENDQLQHELRQVEQQRQEREREQALENMKHTVQEYSDQTGISLKEMKAHDFDFFCLDEKGPLGIYLKNKSVVNQYYNILPPEQREKSDVYKTVTLFKKAVSELIKEQPQQTDFTAAPPPKPKHTHVNHRKHTPPPLINGRKLSHEIDYQIQQEKNAALRDYEQAQRAADQERWRMQHRDDWDMD